MAPFVWSDNTCDFCREGLHTSCRHGGFWGANGVDGGQGEAVRVPQAQGTLVKLLVAEDAGLVPSLLTLSDVFCTGRHCVVTAGVGPRTTVTVVGDGAVGLSAVPAAGRLGAMGVPPVERSRDRGRIILMGRHKDRTDLGCDFGATDVVAERGEEGIERLRALTGGDGTHAVLECVGTLPALEMSLGVVRAGGTVSRVGAPQYEQGRHAGGRRRRGRRRGRRRLPHQVRPLLGEHHRAHHEPRGGLHHDAPGAARGSRRLVRLQQPPGC